ncbi:MAG: hypothetical protein ING29_12480 [Azospirillum sp.]|nr:hypothetical protein [Azospirillum sp.]
MERPKPADIKSDPYHANATGGAALGIRDENSVRRVVSENEEGADASAQMIV